MQDGTLASHCRCEKGLLSMSTVHSLEFLFQAEGNIPEEWTPTSLRWSCWWKGRLPEWEEWMGTGAFLPPNLQKSGPENQGSNSEED